MPLVCPNCKTMFQDPGGDPNHYQCNVCGRVGLHRTLVGTGENDAAITLVAGAALGAAIGGVPGAVIGAIIGGFIGSHHNQPVRK